MTAVVITQRLRDLVVLYRRRQSEMAAEVDADHDYIKLSTIRNEGQRMTYETVAADLEALLQEMSLPRRNRRKDTV